MTSTRGEDPTGRVLGVRREVRANASGPNNQSPCDLFFSPRVERRAD